MERARDYVLLVFGIMFVFFVSSIFIIRDQYKNNLDDVRKDNEVYKKELEEKNWVIEYLLEEVQGKRAIECDCDCEWLRNFYDEHSEEAGAYE